MMLQFDRSDFSTRVVPVAFLRRRLLSKPAQPGVMLASTAHTQSRLLSSLFLLTGG